jgi:hypothetical protein
MPYDVKDLRSQLSTAPSRAPSRACFAPQYFEFSTYAPDEVSPGGTKTWYVRSQSCVVAYSAVEPGDHVGRDGHPDEYMALFPSESTAASVSASGDRQDVRGASVVVVPPGDSEIAVDGGGVVVRVFSNQAADLLARCVNAAVYDEPDPNVPPFTPWPDPPQGHRIRVYPLAAVPNDGTRFGRLFRCSTVMVNEFLPDVGARDPSKMSPHHHDDFEQISLQLEGNYVHHIRTPWTVNMADWRDDDHRYCTAPSVTIIPPPTVHTSQSVDDTRHHLVDIFAPPRFDFSERPGWVLNHDEYPMPARA